MEKTLREEFVQPETHELRIVGLARTYQKGNSEDKNRVIEYLKQSIIKAIVDNDLIEIDEWDSAVRARLAVMIRRDKLC